MASRTRVVSSSSSTASPSRPPETALEIAYNTAVQSFVRRDHVKTQASLSRLLGLVKGSPSSVVKWHNLEGPYDLAVESDEWKVKVLKLVISANASLYADPPVYQDALDASLVAALPPAQPSSMLERSKATCIETLDHPDLLPPPVISTLLLASLKLQPPSSALHFAHHLAEDWLARLPDSFVQTLSSTTTSDGRSKKRIEGAKEGYLKVIELFVGEVLAREGEFGMARSLLDGDEIMSSKRKEGLYRHLRIMETKSQGSHPPFPSTSETPRSPSASLVIPTHTQRPTYGTSPSSSRTTSSSSSERTARPKDPVRSVPFDSLAKQNKGQKSKSVVDGEKGSIDTNSTFHVPEKIYINPNGSPSPARRPPTSQVQRSLGNLLDLVPASFRKRLLSSWPMMAIPPITFITLLLSLVLIRRKWSRRNASSAGAGAQTIIPPGMRSRLESVRRSYTRRWLGYWLAWWWGKLAGVWTMGTSITYL